MKKEKNKNTIKLINFSYTFQSSAEYG